MVHRNRKPKITTDRHLIQPWLILTILLVISSFPGTSNAIGESAPKSMGRPGPLSDDDPIVITSDLDLRNKASANGWEGNGTPLNPYVIEDLDINGSGSAACLRIENVSVHFVVTSCNLYGADRKASTDWENGGLVLVDASNGTVRDNTISDNLINGVSMIDTDASIVGNNFSGNDVGVYARWTRATIEGNGFTDNNQSIYSRESYVEVVRNDINDIVGDKYSSVYVYKSNSSIVRGNNISNARYGIQLKNSYGTVIDSNRILNTSTALWIWIGQNTLVTNNHFDSSDGVSLGDLYSTFHNNTFLRGGIGIAWGAHDLPSFNTHDISINNTYEGRPILYMKNQTGRTIDSSYGQIIIANCSDFTLEDSIQTDCYRITIAHSPRMAIHNNTIETEHLRCESSDDMSLTNNTIRNCRVEFAEGTDFVTVDGNTFVQSQLNLYRNSGDVISNNTITNRGIQSLLIYNSPDTRILNNTLKIENPGIGSSSVYVVSGGSLTLRDNKMHGSGIHLWSDFDTWKNHDIDETNSLNGFPVVYLKEETGINISRDVGQVILAECRDISLANLTMVNRSPMVQMALCKNVSITGCDMRNNKVRYAVEAWQCDGMNLRGNNVEGNYSCFYLQGCDHVNITRNRIANSTGDGIYLGLVDDCLISENDIVNCSRFGIYMYGAGNTVTLNNFVDNNLDPETGEAVAPQCWDAGSMNNWSLNERGNHWSDYRTKYPNASYSEGVWLTPYELDGSANTYDEYPLVHMYDYIPPRIAPMKDMVVDQGENITLVADVWDNVDVTEVRWTFNTSGGPTTLYGRSINFTFVDIGSFQVTVTVYDTSSNEASTSFNVTVRDATPPNVVLSSTATVGQNVPLVLNGSVSTDNVGIVSWSWTVEDIGGPYRLQGAVVEHTFGHVGVFNVTLNVTDAAGNWAKTVMTVTVTDKTPPSVVAGEDVEIDQGDTVTFDGRSSTDNVGIVNWSWSIVSFQTGETIENLHHPTFEHTFVDAGLYRVVLMVTDAAGNMAGTGLDVLVRDITPPVADAGEDMFAELGHEVSLNGSLSSDNVGVAEWNWTFEDVGTTQILTGPTPHYVFEYGGVYTVLLTVIDSAGNSANDTVKIRVIDTTPPIAKAGTDIYVDQHDEVTFNGTASSDNVAVMNWTWRFEYDGRDRVLHGRWATFVFDQVGAYQVSLYVTDWGGNIDSDNVTVTVADITPPVAVAGPNITVKINDDLVLNGSASTDNVGIVSWRWTLETRDGELMGSREVENWTFQEPGEYTVVLTVTDAAGNEGTTEMTVIVEDITIKGGPPTWVYIVILCVMILIVLVVILVIIRGKGNST